MGTLASVSERVGRRRIANRSGRGSVPFRWLGSSRGRSAGRALALGDVAGALGLTYGRTTVQQRRCHVVKSFYFSNQPPLPQTDR